MPRIFEVAAKIHTMWSLAAFVSALLFFIAVRHAKGKVSSIVWGVTVAVLILGLVPIIGSLYEGHERERTAQLSSPQIYELIVSLKTKEGGPLVTDATVRCSLGIRPDPVGDSWEFKIPPALRPTNKQVEISAEAENGTLAGVATLVLDGDFHPTLAITMERKPNVRISGNVFDANGRGIIGAVVSVGGHGGKTVTRETGYFELPAYATDGQEITIHAEKQGFEPKSQGHLLNGTTATIVLFPPAKRASR